MSKFIPNKKSGEGILLKDEDIVIGEILYGADGWQFFPSNDQVAMDPDDMEKVMEALKALNW